MISQIQLYPMPTTTIVQLSETLTILKLNNEQVMMLLRLINANEPWKDAWIGIRRQLVEDITLEVPGTLKVMQSTIRLKT